MSMEYVSYFRPGIDAMSGYTPGEQPKLESMLKLNTNESPYPPSPGVQRAMAEFDAARLRFYPDPVASDICTALASGFHLPSGCVIAGNGSDDILNLVIRCFCDSERPVAIPDVTYSLYPVLASLQGAGCIRIPLDEDFQLPEDIVERAGNANLLMIPRPSAPAGNSFLRERMAEICRSFRGIVLIDEAYADFASDNCVDFVREMPNVIVARTFSKSRSLAGLRFGYAFAHPAIIAGLMKMKDSYNVSSLAQHLALASLRDEAYFQDCIAKIKLAREMLFLGLLDLGFRVIESEANFLFASPPDGDAERYFHRLREKHVIVRYFPGARTGKFVRISIGTPRQMSELFILTRQMYGSPLRDL